MKLFNALNSILHRIFGSSAHETLNVPVHNILLSAGHIIQKVPLTITIELIAFNKNGIRWSIYSESENLIVQTNSRFICLS